MAFAINKNAQRKEAWDKVTGKAKYIDDLPTTGILFARILTSPHAHANIKSINVEKAFEVEGVKSVLTGAECTELFGPLMLDRPALARNVVRYTGEPIAMVIAKEESIAELALSLIEVEYELLPVILTPSQGIDEKAILIHKDTSKYKKAMVDINPENGTNIASSYKIKKGNALKGFDKCEIIVQKKFTLPPSDHLAMEIRSAQAEVSSEGEVLIKTSSQSPYAVRNQISEAFKIPSGKIQVKVPFVGGGFGGKASIFIEILAYLASQSVGGTPVRVVITREQDMTSAPARIGIEADIKVGVDKNGIIQAAEMTYLLDCGAYTDSSPYMTKAVAVDCTGPYRIENLICNALCVYTNHTYATSYRGFAHESCTFCIERVLDILANKCKIDPIEFRIKNAIRSGDKTPSQVLCTDSLIGNLRKCLDKVKVLSKWDNGEVVHIKKNTVSAKGISCLWKTQNPPTNAISGAVITFNPDGSVNLNTGVVEMGSGGQTHLAQILAEKLQIHPDQVHIVMSVDTRIAPEHWKTVASITEYMAGNAVLRAADDLIYQLRINGAQAFNCPIEEIEVANGRVFSKNNQEKFIAFKDIVQGYKSKDGESIGEPVIGRGGFMLKGLSMLDPQTGKGKTGPSWTLGAQVVEVEADLRTCSYRIISASTVMDVGKVINPELMRSVIAGGMAMGISMSSREAFNYKNGIMETPNLRSYKLMHIGQEPDYRVGFVETPEGDSPYGVRSYAEHGIIGIPAALGNALSAAFGKEILSLPLTPENIWKEKKEDVHDSI